MSTANSVSCKGQNFSSFFYMSELGDTGSLQVGLLAVHAKMNFFKTGERYQKNKCSVLDFEWNYGLHYAEISISTSIQHAIQN